jgi:hypothetical protein
MAYYITAKIINMAVIISMAMVAQRAERGGSLVTHRKSRTCSGIRAGPKKSATRERLLGWGNG